MRSTKSPGENVHTLAFHEKNRIDALCPGSISPNHRSHRWVAEVFGGHL